MKTKAQTKIDLYKQYRDRYLAPAQPTLVEITPASYLAVSGQGAPGQAAFTTSIGALYAVAFTVKMTRKFRGQQDYAVCKLEAQYWTDGFEDFSRAPRDQWQWKLLIRTPGFITATELQEAVAVLLKRGKSEDVKRVRLESLAEGRCVQMLHVGPYDKERETVSRMKGFAEEKGFCFRGRHHDIYLSDPRRVPPERLKTIVRLPLTPRGN